MKYTPRRDYVREMIRYGVLPVDHDFNASVDPFELDKAYWEMFRYAQVKHMTPNEMVMSGSTLTVN